MIPPRLSEGEIVATARLLPSWDVAVGDRRLAHLEEWVCRCAALAIPDSACFVAWPDMTLGFVVFTPGTSTQDLLTGQGGRLEEADHRDEGDNDRDAAHATTDWPARARVALPAPARIAVHAIGAERGARLLVGHVRPERSEQRHRGTEGQVDRGRRREDAYGRGTALRPGDGSADDLHEPVGEGGPIGVPEPARAAAAHGAEGAESVAHDAGDSGRREAGSRGLRTAGEHQQRWAAAGEQWRRGSGSHARVEDPSRADRTFEGDRTWRRDGHRSGVRARRR